MWRQPIPMWLQPCANMRRLSSWILARVLLPDLESGRRDGLPAPFYRVFVHEQPLLLNKVFHGGLLLWW